MIKFPEVSPRTRAILSIIQLASTAAVITLQLRDTLNARK